MANFYNVNTKIRLSVAFTSSGTPADPTGIVLVVTDPAGTSTTYTYALAQVVKDSTGNYHYDITVSSVGEWNYAWTGTGAVIAGTDSYFYVG